MRNTTVALVYVAVLGIGLFQTFRPTWVSGFSRFQSDCGDSVLNHYILEHSWQSVSNLSYCGSLPSPPCFSPQPYTLWYSEHLLGVAPIYWALRIALPHDLAYQWWQIVLEVLNFGAFALVVRWLRGPHALALLGGYLWAFSLVNVHEIRQQQMIPRFAMVLAVYHAWQFVLALGSTPANPLRHLNRMLAAVFLQAVTCVYTGWFLVVGLGTFLLLALLLQPDGWRNLARLRNENRSRATAIVAVWGGALIAAYVPYFLVNWGMNRAYSDCVGLLPTPVAWLAPMPGTVWEQLLGPLRNQALFECWLFCGFGIGVLMLVAFCSLLASLVRQTDRSNWRPEFGLAFAGLLTAIIWVLLTMKFGKDEFSLWQWVRMIPGGMAIRCVQRVHVMVDLFGMLAAIVWLARVSESLRPSLREGLLALFAIACIVEQQADEPPSVDKRDFYAITDRIAIELKKGDIGYVIPRYTDTQGRTQTEPAFGEVLGMWAGMRANVPVVNGYSGRTPDRTFMDIVFAADADDRKAKLRKWLAGKFRGTLVLVDPDHPEATEVLQIE